MKSERFNELVNKELLYCFNILLNKSKEYAEEEPDRLEAFKHAAAFERTTPQKALLGMMTKHLISVEVMCEKEDMTRYSMERWAEKITDSINYMILLLSLAEEAHENARPIPKQAPAPEPTPAPEPAPAPAPVKTEPVSYQRGEQMTLEELEASLGITPRLSKEA